jgi:thioredoxin-related protein
MIRRIASFTPFASLLLILATLTPAQTPTNRTPATKTKSASTTKSFEPLNQWKSAVLNGDRPTLQSLYAPSGMARLPQGDTNDPNEEPIFWSSLRAAGLTAIDPKILERQIPKPGQLVLITRVFLTVQSNNESKEFIMSLTQLWQQEGTDWKIQATQRSNPAPRPTIRLTEPATTNPDLYPDPNEAQKDLAAAQSAAATDHKNVIVVFGGNWCYDCHVLDATFKSPAIAPILKANYHVVHINIGEYDQNLALAAKYQTVLTHGVPALAVLDPKGNLLTSQKNGEFESAVKIGPADITDFLKQWKPKSP